MFIRHSYKSITLKNAVLCEDIIKIYSNEQLAVRKHRVAGIGRLPTGTIVTCYT